MLIRQGGGNDDIKEYLENGMKQGSPVHRDVKDKRVILDGDLDIVNYVIQSIDSTGERYSHYTVSFKEDFVSRETLDLVTQRLKKFLGAAYAESEFSFYAEAHLPKIKSYTDNKTGELVTRKPHIHIIIPKRNVIDDKHLDPLGYYKKNIKYIEAIQELLNIELKLESPKDNKRTPLTDGSDIISRYKGDIFKTDARRIKEKILNDILDSKIQSWVEFENLVKTYGDLSVRNAGKENSYLNVKDPSAAKGVNLKEVVFSREFIESTYEEKLLLLSGKIIESKPRDINKEKKSYETTLSEWYERRCHEIRYMNPNSKKWKEYSKLSNLEKKIIIANFKKQSAIALKARLGTLVADPFSGTELFIQLTDENKDPLNENDLDSVKKPRRNRTRPSTQRKHRMRSLSECTVVHYSESGAEVLVPNLPRTELADKGAGTTRRWDHSLRRDLHQSGLADLPPEQTNAADGTPESFIQDLNDQVSMENESADTDWKQLQSTLDLDEFLNNISQTHGINREHYQIVVGRNGDGRIKSGSRRLSPSDFLTKELNMDWEEAKQILLEADKRQKGGERAAPRNNKTGRSYWSEFREWQYGEGNSFKELWAMQKESEKKRLFHQRQQFKIERNSLFSQHMTPDDRNVALSLLRIKKMVEEEKLRESFIRERDLLKSTLDIDLRYLTFLRERIHAGDAEALEEFRRYAKAETKRDENKNTFDTENAKASILDGYSYELSGSGSVTYIINDTRVVEDTRDWVAVLQEEDDDAIEIALRLTMDKFYGKNIILTGSDDFKRRVAEVAAQRNINVTFEDTEMQRYHSERLKSKHGQEFANQAGPDETKSPSSTQPPRRGNVTP